jgi:hypothetical protein
MPDKRRSECADADGQRQIDDEIVARIRATDKRSRNDANSPSPGEATTSLFTAVVLPKDVASRKVVPRRSTGRTGRRDAPQTLPPFHKPQAFRAKAKSPRRSATYVA